MGDEMKCDELLRFAMEQAEEMGESFETPEDNWTPRAFAAKASEPDELLEVQFEFESADAKEEVIQELRSWILDEDISLFSITLVVYALVMDSDDHPEATQRPSTHPDRKKLLLVVALDAEEVKTVVADIQQSGDAPPELDEWDMDVTGFSGSLAEPFRDALKIARRRREGDE